MPAINRIQNAAAPTATDDTEYNIACLWVDTAANEAYICLDNTATAAVWENITLSGNAWVQGGNSFGALGVFGTNDANSVAFETGGVEKMRLIHASGALAIGATAAVGAELLHVAGDVNISGDYELTGAGTTRKFLSDDGSTAPVSGAAQGGLRYNNTLGTGLWEVSTQGGAWIPLLTTATGTWASVLGLGDESGGTDPVITDGDKLVWEDAAGPDSRFEMGLDGSDNMVINLRAAGGGAVDAIMEFETATGDTMMQGMRLRIGGSATVEPIAFASLTAGARTVAISDIGTVNGAGTDVGGTIYNASSGTGRWFFGDPNNSDEGGLSYRHAGNAMDFHADAAVRMILETDTLRAGGVAMDLGNNTALQEWRRGHIRHFSVGYLNPSMAFTFDDEFYVEADTSGMASFAGTLPAASDGPYIYFCDVTDAANDVTLTPAGMDTVNGASSLTLSEGLWFICSDGTSNWRCHQCS